MLRPRIIPCLLVHEGGLVKTIEFTDPKYVGDPLNAVRIFNEKFVDELIVLDIDATVREREPDYDMLERLAAECRMPLCYGGGVRSREQATRIIKLGVEKVALGAAAIECPGLVADIAGYVGSQSVIAVLDIRRDPGSGRAEVWTRNGSVNTGRAPAEVAEALEQAGVGEITLNSIDRDGTMTGYDVEAVAEVRRAVSVPMTVLGGAGSLEDIEMLFKRFGVIGAAAGTLFIFKGPYRAVLINYPGRARRLRLSGMETPVSS